MKNFKIILLISLILFCVISFFIITKNELYITFDTFITKYTYENLSKYKLIVDINKFLTNYTLGSIFAIILVSLVLIIKKNLKHLIIFLLLGSFLFLTEEILKSFFHRIRPFLSVDGISNLSGDNVINTDYSFPSGHSMFAFYIASFLTFRLFGKNKVKYKIALFLLAITTALSRIVLGVHFFSDIIIGAALGYIYGYMSLLIENSKIYNTIWKIFNY